MSESVEKKQKCVGILVGGGPAPGLNGVISAVVIEARRRNLKIYGFFDGYKWMVQDDHELFLKHTKELRISNVSRIHFDGGAILRTSRTNPVKAENGISNAVRNLRKLGIDYMVTIGGDDTSYGASEIAKSAPHIRFAHVPKTIDNDLPLPDELPTFGFQTARHLGATLVKNMMQDAWTTNRWYIAVVMGRHAGHLAVGCAKASGATLAIIAEEFGNSGEIPLSHLCDIFEAAILKRRAMGHHHGVLVIAEGVGERLCLEDLKSAGSHVEYDSYGHLRLSEIEIGKLLKREVQKRFLEREEKLKLVYANVGYVLRSAPPIPFDQDYTRELGYHAVRYLMSTKPEHAKNAMVCVRQGEMLPIPFEDIIDPKTKKTAVRFVDIQSASYKIARNYMIRLEQRDFTDREFLEKMAIHAKMTSSEFSEKFQYLVDS